MHIHTHIQQQLLGKRGHTFEREQGGIKGRTWREEKERRDDVTIL